MSELDLELSRIDEQLERLKRESRRFTTESTPVNSNTKQTRTSSVRDSGLDTLRPPSGRSEYSALRDVDRRSVGFVDTPSHTRVRNTSILEPETLDGRRENFMDRRNRDAKETDYQPRADLSDALSNITSLPFADQGVTVRKKVVDRDKIKHETPTVKPMANYMKPATYDGTGSWLDYLAHFEACCNINHWTEEQKGLYLAASLRSQAQTVLGNLPKGETSDFKKLTEALAARFAPANQTELYRAMLKERRLKSTETIPELGESIKRLTHLSYPTVTRDISEVIAKDHFIDALPDFDTRLRVKQSRPKSLNEAIGLAVEIEAFCRTEKDRRDEKRYVRSASGATTEDDIVEKEVTRETKDNSGWMSMLESLQKSIQKLETQMSYIKTNQRNQKVDSTAEGLPGAQKSPKGIQCYYCKEYGHLKRKCPKYLRKVNKDQPQEAGGKDPKDGRSVTRHLKCVQESKNSEAGLFVDLDINGLKAKFLIDTGATVTLVSKETYTAMGERKANLVPLQQDILGANGLPLTAIGKGKFTITVNSYSCECFAVVVDFNLNGILGLDFLKQSKSIINCSTGELSIAQEVSPLTWQGTLGCYRVSMKETVSIPPKTEVVCEGVIHVRPQDKDKLSSDVYITEPIEKFQKLGKALVARTDVQARAEWKLFHYD